MNPTVRPRLLVAATRRRSQGNVLRLPIVVRLCKWCLARLFYAAQTYQLFADRSVHSGTSVQLHRYSSEVSVRVCKL